MLYASYEKKEEKKHPSKDETIFKLTVHLQLFGHYFSRATI